MAQQAGQVTVVTGGSRGIGAAIALRLARTGHDIGIGYERSREAAEETAEAVRATGRRAVTVRGDTAREEDVDRLFDTVRGGVGAGHGAGQQCRGDRSARALHRYSH